MFGTWNPTCAVPKDARGIGQLRASFAHRLRKAVDALLAVHESGTDAGASRIGDGRIELVLISEFIRTWAPSRAGVAEHRLCPQ